MAWDQAPAATQLECALSRKEGQQAWELRMEKSAEKWGPGGHRRPPPPPPPTPVGVQGATPPEAEAFSRK